MSFLKRHYEKIILTVFLIIFVLSLIYLIGTIMTSKNITPDMLNFPRKKPDYRSIDFTLKEFNAMKEIEKGELWIDCGPRNKSDKFWTDFMVPFAAARSNWGKKMITPYYYFENKYGINKCPFTGKELPEPDRVIEVKADKDDDGIPNDKELEYGLDPENPDDAWGDLDGDGFPNVVEYKFNPAAVNNPKLHPSVATRLYVVKILRNRLNIRLKQLMERGDDKKNWEMHFQVRGKTGVWKSKFMKIGDEFQMDGNKKYKIIDIQSRKVPEYDKTIKAKVEKDRSIMVFEPVGSSEKISAVVDKPVYALKERVYLKDSVTDAKYRGIVGENITLGNDEIGREEFKVISANQKSDEVLLKRIKDNKEFVVTKEKMELPTKGRTVEGRRDIPALPEEFDIGRPDGKRRQQAPRRR